MIVDILAGSVRLRIRLRKTSAAAVLMTKVRSGTIKSLADRRILNVVVMIPDASQSEASNDSQSQDSSEPTASFESTPEPTEGEEQSGPEGNSPAPAVVSGSPFALRTGSPSNRGDGEQNLLSPSKLPSVIPLATAPTARPTGAPSFPPARATLTSPPTQAPTAPPGSCCPPTCSGHGVCSEALCACVCDPGWFRTNCSDFVLEAWVNGSTNECQGASLRLNLSAVLPGMQTVGCSEERTAWKARSSLELSVKAAPTALVTCQLTSQNPAEAKPANLPLEFSGDDYAPKSAELRGLVDVDDDGEQPFEIGVLCISSGDKTFNTAGLTVKGNNFNVPFPSLDTIFPITVAYIGTQITVRGKHFTDYADELEVFVGGIKVRVSAQGFHVERG